MNFDFWNRAPFIRLIVPFILGVVLEIQNDDLIDYGLPLFLVITIAFILGAILNFNRSLFLNARIVGTLLLLAIFFGGYNYAWFSRSIHYNTHFSKLSEDQSLYKGVIYEPPQEKSRSVKAFVSIHEVGLNGDSKACIGNLLVYFQKTDDALNLQYGDEIVFTARPNEIKPPDNPAQFDFKSYLRNNDIYHQAYIKEGTWERVGDNQANQVKYFAFQSRRKLLRTLEAAIDDEQNLAVGSALILGYKDRLDPEILRSFSSAGAMHVLAVSGLHVGIIFIVLQALFKNFGKRRNDLKIFKVVIILLALWLYAFITGMSPSVMRAALMFSFIVVGQNINRATNIYNTLSASAFLLILFDPHIVVKVGFQLSYLAVIGIVYLHPKLYALYNPKNWLLDKIWSITCVSCAAQLATFPLGLYYFHQFPVYFFISNLIVIPFATGILYTGILLLILYPLGLGDFFSGLLNWMLNFLNQSVVFVEEIPYSLIFGNFIGVAEVLILYLIVALVLLWFYLKRKAIAFSILGLITLALLISASDRYQNALQNTFVVYKVPNESVVNYIKGDANYLIANSAFLEDDGQQLYYIKHFWFQQGHVNASKVKWNENIDASSDVIKHNNLIQINDFKCFRMDSTISIQNMESLDCDILLLSGDIYFDINDINEKIHAEKWVIDSSVPFSKSKKLEAILIQKGIDVYNVNEKGAYVASIDH